MSDSPSPQPSKPQPSGCSTTLWLLAGPFSCLLLFLAFIFFIVAMAIQSKFLGEWLHMLTGGGGGGTGQTVNCANVATVPSEYMAYVKDAAQKFDKGDEAALIAIIQTESGWSVTSINPKSNASGLGNFLTSTARGYKEYTGGTDRSGTSWPAGTIYDKPAEHSDDARFEAKRAIYATADLLGSMLDKYGSLGEAYAQGYHGGAKLGGDYAAEAAAGRARLEKLYSSLITGGGCQAQAGSGGSLSASERGERIAQIAEKYIGTPTTFDPSKGEHANVFHGQFATKSCASFVSVVLQEAGAVNQFRANTTGVWNLGGEVIIDRGGTLDVSKLERGDIVWFGFGTTSDDKAALFNHIGVYVGNGMVVNTSSSKKKVVKDSINVFQGGDRFAAAKRF